MAAGHGDSDFLSDFGYNGINNPSCDITNYLELTIPFSFVLLKFIVFSTTRAGEAH
jgi:hypothetical protein